MRDGVARTKSAYVVEVAVEHVRVHPGSRVTFETLLDAHGRRLIMRARTRLAELGIETGGTPVLVELTNGSTIGFRSIDSESDTA